MKLPDCCPNAGRAVADIVVSRRRRPLASTEKPMLETVAVGCPYCGEGIELLVDCSVADQEYVEDCSVCCRPIVVFAHVSEHGDISVNVHTENE